MARTLLISGPPGIGKTTLVRRVASGLQPGEVSGFLTEEVRGRSGHRTGFRALTFDGRDRIIAAVGLGGASRVGRYGVDVDAIDSLVETLEYRQAGPHVFLVDEIGKMECLSARFVAAMRRLLDSPALVVAAVALRGGGFIAEVKRRPGTTLWTVSYRNRDELPERILGWLHGARGNPERR